MNCESVEHFIVPTVVAKLGLSPVWQPQLKVETVVCFLCSQADVTCWASVSNHVGLPLGGGSCTTWVFVGVDDYHFRGDIMSLNDASPLPMMSITVDRYSSASCSLESCRHSSLSSGTSSSNGSRLSTPHSSTTTWLAGVRTRPKKKRRKGQRLSSRPLDRMRSLQV